GCAGDVRAGAGRERSALAHLERAQALDRFVADLEVAHLGAARALLREADHPGDRFGVALEHGLDRPVAAVANPPAHALGGGAPAHAVTKEHSLDAAVGDDVAADGRVVGHARSVPAAGRAQSAAEPAAAEAMRSISSRWSRTRP